jgi:molybdopterin-guanine dinucleotide biosynthesis protein A
MAGGASSRFGMDKALAELGDQTLLARVCTLVEQTTDSASVVAPAGKYRDFGKRIVEDNWPGQGPLGGIITALMDARAQNHLHIWCLIVGCDMPFLTSDWLSYLVGRAFASGAGAVAPRSALGLEPLCACWHTRAAGKLQYALEDGVRKVTEAMKRIETEVVDEKEWKRFDKDGRLFWNMNTQADYEEAQRVLNSGRK